jgi:hypothetical protein
MDIVCNNGVIKLSPNLFDNSTLYNWYFKSGTITFKSNRYAKYMSILSSETYTISRNDNYDAPVKIVQTEVTPDDGVSYAIDGTTTYVHIESNQFPYTFTSRGSAKFLVISADSTLTEAQSIDLFNKLQVELGSVATSYHPYGTIYTDGTVETVEITGRNLFNKNAVENGYRLTNVLNKKYGTIGSSGDFILATDCFVSALIPVKVGKTYIKNSPSEDAFHRFKTYDANQMSVRMGNDSSITIESGEAYIAFCGYSTELDSTTLYDSASIQTATTYEPYFDGGTATAENLFKVGTYQDVQSVIDGSVTRNVGILILDGTEEWNRTSTGRFYNSVSGIRSDVSDTDTLKCSHFKQGEKNAPLKGEISFRLNFNGFILVWGTNATVEQFKQWLSDQYNAGTPVIIVYPLATPTTESVAGQTMQVQAGDNYLEITQASLDGLELEAKYKKGV